jgi:hypothetical protein
VVLVVSLIFKIKGLNENNKQFGKNVVGHPTPDRSFSKSSCKGWRKNETNISDTTKRTMQK